jgi:hypothetical protein
MTQAGDDPGPLTGCSQPQPGHRAMRLLRGYIRASVAAALYAPFQGTPKPPELHAWSRIALIRVYVEVASARMERAMARRLAHRSGMVTQ